MKLLLDQNIPVGVEQLLQEHGWDAVHTRTLGMARATDHDLLAYALRTDRVVVSADRDFGDLLRTSGASHPSLVFLRLRVVVTSAQVAGLLISGLEDLSSTLESGCIVTLTDASRRIKSLPIE
ncbi:MAG: DUF5615 family PIN-like protein [Actinomycetes bacterium]